MINKIFLLFLFYPCIVFSISFSSCNSNTSKEVNQETLEELAQLDAIKIAINPNDEMQFDKDETLV